MSGLAGMINWDGTPVDPIHIELMMRMIEHRGPDGLRWQVKEGIALGHATLALKKSEELQKQPVWLPDKSCGIVADARLYNRNELLSRLGKVDWFEDSPSDAAILLAAYERWGVECLKNLDGDFAFAIWDRDKNRLFAARDPFGVKPFFYRIEKDRFLFASEPKQILVLPEVPVEPDDHIIGEYLFIKIADPDRSFFDGINRLTPAHYMIASTEGTKKVQYWNPDPRREIHFKNKQEYFDLFRLLVKKSISKRLDTDYPVGAHLSGGFDSSSIVVMAAEIYKNNGANLPQFETISAVFGDLPCDEQPYIDAVIEKIPFNANIYSPLDEQINIEDLLELLWWRDSPLGTTHPGFFNGSFRALTKMGARVLLDGAGGDEIASEDDYLRDLALQHKFGRLFYETWMASGYTENSFFWLLKDSLSLIAPNNLKRIYRSIKKPIIHNRTWVQPHFLVSDDQNNIIPIDERLNFNSLTQALIYKGFNSTLFQWGLEGIESQGAYYNYSSTHPYCDRELIEYTLAIPFQNRLPNGQSRYLQRESFRSKLPSIIRDRKRYTKFNSYVALILNQLIQQITEELFSSNIWCSEKYIIRQNVITLLDNFNANNAKSDTEGIALTIWIIFYLEMWLRGFERYHSPT